MENARQNLEICAELINLFIHIENDHFSCGEQKKKKTNGIL